MRWRGVEVGGEEGLATRSHVGDQPWRCIQQHHADANHIWGQTNVNGGGIAPELQRRPAKSPIIDHLSGAVREKYSAQQARQHRLLTGVRDRYGTKHSAPYMPLPLAPATPTPARPREPATRKSLFADRAMRPRPSRCQDGRFPSPHMRAGSPPVSPRRRPLYTLHWSNS